MTRITSDDLITQIATSMAHGIAVTRTFGDNDFMVAMPQTLDDGSPVLLRVAIADGYVTATDEELVADHLDTVGVDLEARTNASSWSAIREGIGFGVPLGCSKWELSARASMNQIGPLLQSVADAAIRGDALRIMAPGHRVRTFGEQLQVQFQRSEVVTVPRARVPGKGGARRQVTFSAGKSTPRYVQALSGAKKEQRLTSYDHALSVFTTSAVDMEQRIALFQGPLGAWEKWQVAAMSNISKPVDEQHVDQLIETILAEDARAA